MSIDLHAHWIPKALSDELRKRTTKPFIHRGPDGREWLDSVFLDLPLDEDFDVVPTRLAQMDHIGVTHGVLSLTTVYGIECLPMAESLRLCKLFNDGVAAACAAHPDRFSGLAALPNADIEGAVAELERAMELPGFVGALLPGDGFLSAKRAEQFRPLLAAANRRRAILLVHYGKVHNDTEAPKIDGSDNAGLRYGTLDMQARLSSNMLTFCLTDFLSAYPDVTILSHNLGGNIAYEVERMDHRTLIEHPADVLPSTRIRAARVMVDCNSLGARSIERAVEVYGVEKIVLGTDGTEFGMKWSLDAIAEARLSDAEKQAILSGNAERAMSRVITRRMAVAA